MSHDTIQVLLVEDSAADAYLMEKFLADEETINLVHVECLNEALDVLKEKPFNAVLLDLSLPDSRSIKTVQQTHSTNPEIPIVVLTGLDDEEIAIAALREGAQDYLVKGEINRAWLVRAIHYAIERQQHLEQLQHLNQELMRSNQELEQFAYVVSHDLQQPLQVIFGFARLLENAYSDRPTESANRYLPDIIKATQHMSQLIQDLLNYSRVGKSAQSLEQLDSKAILDQVLSDLSPSIHQSKAVITTNGLPMITAHETQMVQLFGNLLSNALKYHTPEHPPHVKIFAEVHQNEWLFGVQDDGIGIEPENFDQIFQIFQRLHHRKEYPGTGIGLATCKKIVENHGGRIWVDSTPGTGSTFYFTLPTL